MHEQRTPLGGEQAGTGHFASRSAKDVIAYVEHVRASAEGGIASEASASQMTAIGDALGRDSWLSYEDFRHLLELAGRALGDPSKLREAIPWAISTGQAADVLEPMVALGSVEAVYDVVEGMVENLMPLVAINTERRAPRERVFAVQLRGGFALFPELRVLMAGACAIMSIYAGCAPAEVTEEQGGDGNEDALACRLRVCWQEEEDEESSSDRIAELRIRSLETSLAEFQDLVADVVSGDGTSEVLGRIVRATLRSAAVSQCALILEPGVLAPARVIEADGFDASALERLADGLLGGTLSKDPARLVVEVASGRRRFGYLVVVDHTTRVSAQSPRLVQTYARLAAAFLDATVSLQESRRQAATAKTLLELSSALAEIATPDEMALKLARAVPKVIGCERALVYLVDPKTSTTRLAGAHGYDEELLVELRDSSPEAVADQGSQIVPIVVDGETLGWVLAQNPSPAADEKRLAEGLKGLAAQGASAIENAYLLDQIRHNSLHDVLTGLANRALILDRLERMLLRNRRSHAFAAALFIDLDGFKHVNDTLGHEAGDWVLRAVAERLSAAVREADTIGRLGGDEFVVLLDGSTMDVGPELVAERLLAVLAEPFELPNSSMPSLLTSSIGIAIGDGQSSGELLRDADVALYRAKHGGKNKYVVFAPEMQTAVRDHMVLEMDLRSALEREQFFLVYQPIFNLADGEVTAVEALLRWRHPERGVVQPDHFIPTLEETGVIREVGRWVLGEACEEAVRLREQGHALTMTVNVAVCQLEYEKFVEHVRDAIAASGLDPRSVILEITETALMRDVASVVPRLEALRRLGVRIAIDDFGTGYSSLAYLQQFPVDTIKIDRSFISAMSGSNESATLVRTLVQLGRTLKLETLAEGIEEAQQYVSLRHEQCDSGQGYLFAKPLNSSDLLRFMSSQPRQEAIRSRNGH